MDEYDVLFLIQAQVYLAVEAYLKATREGIDNWDDATKVDKMNLVFEFLDNL